MKLPADAGRLALVLAVLGHSAFAAAQSEDTDLTELSLEELLDVEITSVSKKTEKRTEAAAAVYVLTQEDIRRAGVRSIPDALRLVPGIAVAQIDSNKWSVSSRGGAGRFSNKLLVLIDGRSVYTPFFSGVIWETNDVLLEDIDRIEVIRGPGGALWGANAVNGVINIVRKRASETQGGYLSGGTGTEEQVFGEFRYGGTISDDVFYRVYGKYFQRDSGELTTGGDAHDDWEMGQAGFRVDWTPGERDTLTLQGDAFDNNSRTRHVTFNVTPPRTTLIDSTIDYKGNNLLGRWTRRLSDESDLQLQLYWDHFQQDQVIFDEIRDTIDLDFQHRFKPLDRHEIIWGAGYRVTTDDFDNTFQISLDPEKRTDHLFQVFVQDTITLTDELRLILGARFEHNDYSGFEIQPSARMAWTPNKRHTVWGAVSRAVRTPTRSEEDLTLVFASVPGVTLPDQIIQLVPGSNLEAEDLLAFEAGYRVMLRDDLAVDVAAFYNFYDDVRAVEVGAPFVSDDPPPSHEVVPILLNNDGDGEAYGFEIVADYQPWDWWRVRAGYSNLQISGDDIGEGLSPEHQVFVESHFDLPKNVDVGLILRYVDDLPDIDVDEYVTLDLRVAWRPRENIELALVGRNLLEEDHLEFVETIVQTVPSEVERGVYFQLSWWF